MMAISLTAACSPASAQAAPPHSDRDGTTAVLDTDPEMNAAIVRAQTKLSVFLDALESPPAGTSAIVFKFPLAGWEHIWVSNVRRDGEYLTGTLNNAPIQEGWSEGDPVRVPLENVSDWGWRGRDGVMRGHFTTRVLLDRMEPTRAARIKEIFGWDD